MAKDVNTAENKNDIVIVVDRPDTDDDQKTQLHLVEAEPVVLEPEGRPQRHCRPPDWLDPYEINI